MTGSAIKILFIFILIGESICQENFLKYLPVQDPNSYYSTNSLININGNESDKLLYFFSGGTGVLGQFSHLTQSYDGGISWSDPIRLPNYGPSDLNITISSTGRIMYIAGASIFNLIYSDDQGLSWSVVGNILSGFSVRDFSFINLPDNKIGLLNTSMNTLRIMYSEDDGLTWSSPDTILTSVQSSRMIISGTGEYFLFIKRPADNNIYILNSSDGVNWSDSRLLVQNNTELKKINCAVSDAGKIIVTFEKDVATPFDGIFQTDIFRISSSDNGYSWNAPTPITTYKGDDKNHNINSMNGKFLISFISNRDGIKDHPYFGFLPDDTDIKTPPYIYDYHHLPDEYSDDLPITIRALVDDDTHITSVKAVLQRNEEIPQTIFLRDNGLHNDSLPNDKIFGGVVPFKLAAGNAVSYYCIAEDDLGNIASTNKKFFSAPLDFNVKNYLFDNNRFQLPFGHDGNIGTVNIPGYGSGGKYDEGHILFSGGFFLSGYSNDFLWVNGVFRPSLIQDYNPGKVGSYPQDPKNIIYVIRSDDPPFGESWQNYRYAVMNGAPFYDGDFDGIYDPVDKNNNGIWDEDEDAPEMLGDITTWCVYNDSKQKFERRLNDVYPLGIEIQQTAFSFYFDENNLPDEKIYFRYRIINRGNESTVLDSVIFSFSLDHDIGDHNNDLVACDTLLNVGYAYSREDAIYGINPPAAGVTLVQGPPVYIPGVTFIDVDYDGFFNPFLDIPIDTAVSKTGSGIPTVFYPGAKNQSIISLHVIYAGFSVIDPIQNRFGVRNLQLGKRTDGLNYDPCNFPIGVVSGSVNCAEVNPVFHFSGDPVTQVGWINSLPWDIRFLLSTGPFQLRKDEPVDIWGVYVVGRGEDSLLSITEMKNNVQSTHNFYKQLPLYDERIPPVILPVEYRLFQNFPNPFNPGTIIRYQIPEAGFVSLKVYDILGREVATLVNEEKTAGSYEVEFNTQQTTFNKQLASGVYFYRLQAGNFIQTRKMVLIR